MNNPLYEKIKSRDAKICVLGLGYIGLPTAAMFATHGFNVLGVDINQDVVNTLNNGELPIQEPGLKTLVNAAFKSENLYIDCEPESADVFVIAVPTPITEEKNADLDYVISAAKSIKPYLANDNLVVLESTSPPRTTVGVVQPILEETGLIAGKDFMLVYSPERVLPGRILKELVDNSRVIGGINQSSVEAGRDLYSSFVEGEILLTDATTAEMIKLMENTYRDINIAIANEFSRLGEYIGINVWEAIQIANRHPRVEILEPGPGVGGHCISVDPWFLVEHAPEITPLIQQARKVNDTQPEFVVNRLAEEIGGLEEKEIAALGVTYKANVDDTRESPALRVVELLMDRGATVKVYDPYIRQIERLKDVFCESVEKAIIDVDAILLLVDHSEFYKLSIEEISKLVYSKYILDTRNIIKHDEWQKAGFTVFVLGRKAD